MEAGKYYHQVIYLLVFVVTCVPKNKSHIQGFPSVDSTSTLIQGSENLNSSPQSIPFQLEQAILQGEALRNLLEPFIMRSLTADEAKDIGVYNLYPVFQNPYFQSFSQGYVHTLRKLLGEGCQNLINKEWPNPQDKNQLVKGDRPPTPPELKTFIETFGTITLLDEEVPTFMGNMDTSVKPTLNDFISICVHACMHPKVILR